MIRDFLINSLKDGAVFLIDSSYWICLFVSLIAIILYLSGLKKAGKWSTISFVIYCVLESFKVMIK